LTKKKDEQGMAVTLRSIFRFKAIKLLGCQELGMGGDLTIIWKNRSPQVLREKKKKD